MLIFIRMKKKILIVDSNKKNTPSLKEFLTNLSGECHVSHEADGRNVKEKSYDVIFVHLGTDAEGDRSADIVRKHQRDAFIVGMGGEYRHHYSEEDLASCDDYYQKGDTFTDKVEDLLNETGILQR